MSPASRDYIAPAVYVPPVFDFSGLENDLIIAGLVLTLELCVFLPFIGWYVVRMIVKNLPTIMDQIASNQANIDAIKKLLGKFGVAGSKMSLNTAIGTGVNMLLPMILQRFFGGLQPPAAPPPPPP